MNQGKIFATSFEVFPPDTEQKFERMNQACMLLKQLDPKFFSVTFGAAGSSQLKTVTTVERLIGNNFKIVPHISCIGMTLSKLLNLLEKYQLLGIRQLVVVRGDFPNEQTASCSEFRYAADLISCIRRNTGDFFHITVAAYPEFHPQAMDSRQDILNFKSKVEAGADSAITQFFYNIDAFSHFMENCLKLNIRIPIIPGVLPIYNFQNLIRFADKCGAEIPLWLRKRLAFFSNDLDSLKKFGLEVVIHLCQSLLSQGMKQFHFYTLNQAELTIKICKLL
ncbi:MAG: methylenetetrahydrofolate reductase [NAD(P)H] [Proteobacteria bacterium]|nr:methylenetetrahydrofolate reductase [NAD(P)H] [Pseudomonadota bacterium]